MKKRRVLTLLCYIGEIFADALAAFVIYLTATGTVSFKQGFLMFLPIFIITYWFGTFSSQLVKIKHDDGTFEWTTGEKGRRVFNAVSGIISFLLIAYWAFVYLTSYTGLSVYYDKLVNYIGKLF